MTGAPTRQQTWLSQPHHDGSGRYVSNQAPRLGDRVDVLVRVPLDAGVEAVHVRTSPDGEATFTVARKVRTTGVDDWWRASLTCHNPVTNYRFLLTGGPTKYVWLNGTGVHERDVPDASDFRLVAHASPPPEWALGAVVYQIFPDRFARSKGADRHSTPEWAVPAAWSDPVDLSPKGVAHQLYGGDLDGITEHLDHLESLGVDVVYMTPFFPARSNHRYDASSFEQIDPLLGGAPALRRLTKAAHERGMKVMGDFTTNHTGNAHEWFLKAAGPGGKNTPGAGLLHLGGRHLRRLARRPVPAEAQPPQHRSAPPHLRGPPGGRTQVAGSLGRARRMACRRREHDRSLACHRRQPRRRPADA